jgi:hypothetical protein
MRWAHVTVLIVVLCSILGAAFVFITIDRTPTGPQSESVTLVGAGDISLCSSTSDEATAELLREVDGIVFTLGDNAYPSGRAKDFAECYDPTWGTERDRTRPSLGNHEYKDPGPDAYFDYFGDAAGPDGKGWYAYDAGSWRVIVLNSNCDDVGCDPGTEQYEWLEDELETAAAECVVAYWHHARFSSGPHQGTNDVEPFWEVLYEAGADVVLSAHDHDYERFGPQTPEGEPDAERGIRQFVVGTGGGALDLLAEEAPNSELFMGNSFGVFEITLGDGEYAWRFHRTDGEAGDSGSDTCR